MLLYFTVLLGLQHEETRPDRDQYVRIHLENMEEPESKSSIFYRIV